MNIAIIGYGKMGKEVEQVALSRGHVIGGVFTEENPFDRGSSQNQIDVVIEFTSPKSAVNNFKICFEQGIPVVTGTTGWYAQHKEVKELCRLHSGTFLSATNFSLGVNIFYHLNKKLAQVMANHPEYVPSIEETHHIEKLDSPSGTAISTAEIIMEEISSFTNWKNDTKVDEDELSIESKREKDVPGTHAVRYKSQIDEIELKHTAFNRKGFALGAVIAAEWIVGKKGEFTMKDVLSL